MKVAITDYSFPDLALEEEILLPGGNTVTAWKERRSPGELVELVRDADAVITQFAAVSREVISAMEKARVIVRYGIGVDNVDLEAAKERGIPVCNVPDYCIDEVADQTLSFVLALTRQVIPSSLKITQGGWGLATPIDQMRALRDMTVGLVGFGRIGREVASRLKAFKCRVLVFDPVVPISAIEESGCEAASLVNLLSQSDLVSLHCPSTPQTRGLINRASLGSMKRGSLLVNVARGDLVDPDALTEALSSGHLAGAALDVFAPEPIPAGHAILSFPNVVLAAHIASVSVPAVKKLRQTAAKLAAMALRGEPLVNIVNGVAAAAKGNA